MLTHPIHKEEGYMPQFTIYPFESAMTALSFHGSDPDPADSCGRRLPAPTIAGWPTRVEADLEEAQLELLMQEAPNA
jgi:hypothetical protein